MSVKDMAGITGRKKRWFSPSDWTGYLFTLPLLIGIIGFSAYPMIGALILSFKGNNASNAGSWVGFKNYQFVVTDPLFWQSVYNTLYMGAFSIVLGSLISFILACLIYNLPWTRWKNFFKSVYFLPNVVSMIATSILFTFLFYPGNEGLLNYLLGHFGIKPIGWFANPSVSRFGIVLMSMWGLIGYNTIIFLAALTSVPGDVYEAAEIDGANWFQKWLFITVPYLKSTIFFVVITGTIATMKRFTDVWLIGGTAGNPAGSLMTVVLYIYRNGFLSSQMGIATAAAYILFFLILILTVGLLFINKKQKFD